MSVSEPQKPRGGRPRKPPERRRSEIITIRLTPREADGVYKYALKHGEPLNVVLRAMLRRYVRE